MGTRTATEREEALATLREEVKPGDTVYTVLRHVSSSGMSRSISPVIIRDGRPWDISYLLVGLGEKFDQKYGGIKVAGAGMDMGFSIVYNLCRDLFSEGFTCIGENCPANDHSNPPYPERVAGSMQHSDPGYALKHEWL